MPGIVDAGVCLKQRRNGQYEIPDLTFPVHFSHPQELKLINFHFMINKTLESALM
jgi:hypothetical protein